MEIALPNDIVLVTGGQTREHCQAEFEQGYSYLKSKGCTNEIALEKEARTTAENILFSKDIIKEFSYSEIIIISSKKRIPRLKFLYKKLFPGKQTFIGAPDSYSFLYYLVEYLYTVVALFDIRGDSYVSQWWKRTFRNSLY